MKRIKVLILIGWLMILGCSGKSPEALRPPTLTKVVMDTMSVTLYWTHSPDSASGNFLKYDVYCTIDSTAYRLEGDVEELKNYKKGETVEDSFEITGLSQDSIYYIHIRTVSGNSIGDGSNQLQGSPRPQFTVSLRMKLSIGRCDSCAVKFSTGELTSALKEADMWVDFIPPDTVSLNSPHYSEDLGVGADTTLLMNLGQKDFTDVWRVEAEPDKYSVAINNGDLVIAKTQDLHYVKIYIDDIDILNHWVNITYGYQNIEDFPYFAPKHP